MILELRSGPQPYPFPIPGHPQHPVETLLEAFAECAESGGNGTASALLGPRALGQTRPSR